MDRLTVDLCPAVQKRAIEAVVTKAERRGLELWPPLADFMHLCKIAHQSIKITPPTRTLTSLALTDGSHSKQKCLAVKPVNSLTPG